MAFALTFKPTPLIFASIPVDAVIPRFSSPQLIPIDVGTPMLVSSEIFILGILSETPTLFPFSTFATIILPPYLVKCFFP